MTKVYEAVVNAEIELKHPLEKKDLDKILLPLKRELEGVFGSLKKNRCWKIKISSTISLAMAKPFIGRVG